MICKKIIISTLTVLTIKNNNLLFARKMIFHIQRHIMSHLYLNGEDLSLYYRQVLTLGKPAPLSMISEKQRSIISRHSLNGGSNVGFGSSTRSLITITDFMTYCSSSKVSPKSLPFWIKINIKHEWNAAATKL